MGFRRLNRRQRLRDHIDSAGYATDGLPRIFTVYLQPGDPNFLGDYTQYKYNFRAAPSQKDPVLRHIRDMIVMLNQHPEHGILMCNHNIQVVPSTKSPPLWPLTSNNDNNAKFYTFFQDFKEFPATVPVSLIPRERPPNDDTIHVRVDGKWLPLREWLLRLADDSILDKRSTSQVTYLWHKRAGNKFRLIALPVELRLMIFEHVIAPAGEVYPLSKVLQDEAHSEITQAQREQSHITLGIGYKNDDIMGCGTLGVMMWGGNKQWPYETREPVTAPDLNLLYVSKQVKQEALRVGWENVRRCFIDHQIFQAVADSKVCVAAHFNLLGRIQLSFTAKSWFKFFGIKTQPTFFQDKSVSLGGYLAKLKDTCNLELRFRDPDDGYNGDPFESNVTSCQTVMTDWIMALAFENIKHIKYIDLVGYVKVPQRAKWIDILARERNEIGYEFDHVEAVSNIFAVQLLPRRCVCRKECQSFYKDRWIWTTTESRYGRFREEKLSSHSSFDFEDGEAKGEE